MGLQRQASMRGYAMAALLVSIGVLAVLMSVALPVWRHQVQREKEEELVFRGQQYARAIGLYQRRFRSFPPSIDVLVAQRFLRKKYKDPMTNDDFVTVSMGQQAQSSDPRARLSAFQPNSGGVVAVTSKSKETSIRAYNGATHYNEWRFVYANTSATVGPGNVGSPRINGPGRGEGQGNPGRGRGGPGGARGPGGSGGMGTPPRGSFNPRGPGGD